MKPTVQRLSDATFRINWEGVPNSSLKINFAALINHFGLEGNFVLLHWQAKPFGLRQWGLYEHQSDRYFSRAFDQVQFGANLSMQTLQIDEVKFAGIRPTAMLYFPDAYVDVDESEVSTIKRIVAGAIAEE